MQIIAWIGTPGDALTAAGAILLAIRHAQDDHGLSAAGFLLVGLSSFLFLPIDLIAGAVLPVIAGSQDLGAFHAAKALFDALFVGGTVCLALGCCAWGLGEDASKKFVRWVAILVGVSGVASGMAALFGGNLPHAMGLTVAVAALAFTWIGIREGLADRSYG